MLRLFEVAAIAAFGFLSAFAGSTAAFAGDQAASIVLNQYTLYRASPPAKYFTPGSLIMGWSYKGVLRLEMVCRNKIDIEKDDALLRAPLAGGDFSAQNGWQFDAGATVTNVLNAEFGGNYVNSVTMKIDNVVVYEYAAEDLRAVRDELLKRPGCAEEVRNKRYRIREYNGSTAGLFQNQRYALGSITYEVNFNKDNPKALSANVQATITKSFQVKFGLTHLNASASTLKGDNVLIGVYPIWRNLW